MKLPGLNFVFILFVLVPTFLSAQIDVKDNNVVIEWNRIAFETAGEMYKDLDHVFLHFGGLARSLAMVHIAIHDALNSAEPVYEQYAYKEKLPGADPVAAVSQSAHDVLVNLFPDKKSELDKHLSEWLQKVNSEEEKEAGIRTGKKSAYAIIKLRMGDGYNSRHEYKVQNTPGRFQMVKGYDYVLKPHLRYAEPFALESPGQFRSEVPPSLLSDEYTIAFNESKEYGCKESKKRSPDQTNFGYWWAEFAEPLLNKIGTYAAKSFKLDLWETARLFALININIYDNYIASWDSKYYYDTWRPVTAIHNADEDGNPDTDKDNNWQPEMGTPPFPEYPSLHSSVGSSGAEILSSILGTHEVYFELESTAGLPGNKIRSYKNLYEAAEQCADSRIMNGFHFRFSTEAGLKMGRSIANYILAEYLRPVEKDLTKKN